MAWYALTDSILEADGRTEMRLIVHAPQVQQAIQPSRTLGAATAHSRWRWASPFSSGRAQTRAQAQVVASQPSVHERPVAVTKRVHVSRELRTEMATMARTLGRSEDDIWAEAAREWLMRRVRNDEPPPTTPAAASLPNVRTRRMWNEIDMLLAEMRQPHYVTMAASTSEPDIPAA